MRTTAVKWKGRSLLFRHSERYRPVAEKPFFQCEYSQFLWLCSGYTAWIYSCADVDQLRAQESGPVGVMESFARLMIIVTHLLHLSWELRQ